MLGNMVGKNQKLGLDAKKSIDFGLEAGLGLKGCRLEYGSVLEI